MSDGEVLFGLFVGLTTWLAILRTSFSMAESTKLLREMAERDRPVRAPTPLQTLDLREAPREEPFRKA